ncbi:hypothetical protein [Gandjariella thermophila]|uniref:Secreted protein n=1 Tax=Gandjariella thermophila TaxID=1931992 RepID=A0A4D4IW35_9PSEU|nr:hypothetical protein [Gandjariella thermophila]GDY28401.1 hypothetical protein GTS_00340 [Gandjariella thermophila]
MAAPTIVGIVAVMVIVLVLLSMLVRQLAQHRHLRRVFGPEYEHAVASAESRRAAERELAEREKRHDDLELRPIPPTARERYTRRWNQVQEEFVDKPTEAVAEADQLLTELMAERGYPTQGFEQQLGDLSVEHAETVSSYREAHAISQRNRSGEASTEELRTAMVRYRGLFDDLLRHGTPGGGARSR